MTDHQPDDPAYCTYETTRHGIRYRCVSEVHKSGGHDLKGPDELPDPLRNYLDRTMASDLEDHTDLVPIDPEASADITNAKRVRSAAGLAERKRHAALIDYEVGTGLDIVDDIYTLDEERWSNNLPADRESLLRIEKRVMAWVLQVGIREDGGS